MSQHLKLLVGGLFLCLLLPLASCGSLTQTYWIPTYTMKFEGGGEPMSYDPRVKAVVNPKEGALVAYYETEAKKGLVYANDYSFSLAEKVVITDNKVDQEETSAKPVANLKLEKSFYFDYYGEYDNIRRKLYIAVNDVLIALDHSKIGKDHEIEYWITGRNSGNIGLSHVLIADVLPAGFSYVSSEYSLSDGKGSFEHKVIEKNNRRTLVLDGRFTEPLPVASKFVIKVRLKALFDQIEKEFEE